MTPFEPGDLQDLVIKLRALMSDYNNCAHYIDASFATYGKTVEEAAASARPALQASGNALFVLLRALERTHEYKKMKEVAHG